MESRHRFRFPGSRKGFVIRVVEYGGQYVGRRESKEGCVFGDEESTREAAALSAYREVLKSQR